MSTVINTPMVDLQNELVVEEAWPKVMPWYTKEGVYTWYHSDIPIGRPIGWRMNKGEPEIKVGIYDTASSNIPYHDMAWDIIKKYGLRGTSSIRGMPVAKERACIADRCFAKITDFGLWAVGWVGTTPANVRSVVSHVATAKSEQDWLVMARASGDAAIIALSERLAAGSAKGMEIHLEETEKMKDAVKKGVSVHELVAKCPNCRAYLASLEGAGVPTEVALASLSKKLGIKKAYAGFDECVADNSDKENPEGFCAYLKDKEKVALKTDSPASAPGAAVDTKGNSMADAAKTNPKGETAPTQEAVKTQETRKDDLEAVMKTIITRIEALEGKAAPGADLMKGMDDFKKSFETFGKQMSDIAERLMALEGKVGVPAVAKRAPAHGAEQRVEFAKMTPNEMLARMNRKT